MRRNRLAVLALVLVGALTSMAATCGMSPDRVTMNTLKSLQATSISLMTTAGSLYSQGKISDAQKLKAETVYNQIKASANAVASATGTVTTVQQGNDLLAPLQSLVTQLQQLVAAFQTGGGS